MIYSIAESSMYPIHIMPYAMMQICLTRVCASSSNVRARTHMHTHTHKASYPSRSYEKV